MLSSQGSRPITHGRTSLRKHYVLTGVGVAALVAAVIVVVGTSSGGGGAGTVAQPSTAGQSLPPGHPAVDGKAGESSPAPVTDDAVQQKIAQLESASADQPDNVAVLLELGDAYFLGEALPEEVGVAELEKHGDVVRLVGAGALELGDLDRKSVV